MFIDGKLNDDALRQEGHVSQQGYQDGLLWRAAPPFSIFFTQSLR